VRGDNAFERKLFIAMSPSEQETYIEGIRQRRLASVNAYNKTVAIKQKARDQSTRDKIDKQSAMMEKELIALDKALSKVEARAASLVALSLIVDSQA
jgi:hypothetical protein